MSWNYNYLNFTFTFSTFSISPSNQDVWVSVCDMSARRSGAGVGVLNGLLYSVGGHDGPLVRKSVECYNPETNDWTGVADMNFCRRNAGTCKELRKALFFSTVSLFVQGGQPPK